MRVDIGDIRLFFDVEGAKLVPQGPEMVERPTLLLLHGGPGFDHSHLKPAHSELVEVSQLVYVDHRGNGRSDRSSPERWNLDQWADDLKALCEALEIERPIVLGISFGGFVAQAFALRHPEIPAKLILSSTAGTMRLDRAYDMFERLGGAKARAVAERFWSDPTQPGVIDPYMDICFPLYNPSPSDPNMVARSVMNPDMLTHFFRPDGEGHRFNFLPDLGTVRCPTLVLAGALDPVTPAADSADLAAALPANLVRHELFEGCGHSVDQDNPERAFAVIRDFIAS